VKKTKNDDKIDDDDNYNSDNSIGYIKVNTHSLNNIMHLLTGPDIQSPKVKKSKRKTATVNLQERWEVFD
jgi:hypothetical protein